MKAKHILDEYKDIQNSLNILVDYIYGLSDNSVITDDFIDLIVKGSRRYYDIFNA